MTHSRHLPYFKFMVDDWLSGIICTHDMATQGVFVNLCARIWKAGGSIPNDEVKLARVLHTDKQMLSKCLALLKQDGLLCLDSEGLLSVKFITAQIAEREDLRAKRSRAGRKGGKANAKQVLVSALARYSEPEPDTKTPPKKSPAKKTNPFKSWTAEDFRKACAEANADGYLPAEDLEDFISYWLEPDERGRFRFALQKSWDTRRRMATAKRMIYDKRPTRNQGSLSDWGKF